MDGKRIRERGGKVELNEAIELLKRAVKYPGTVDQKHFDLTIVPTEDRPKYEQALKTAQLAIINGKITRDEFNRRVHLDT